MLINGHTMLGVEIAAGAFCVGVIVTVARDKVRATRRRLFYGKVRPYDYEVDGECGPHHVRVLP
jgi:hypothetical protein